MPEETVKFKPYALSVVCWKCHRPIGGLMIAEDLLAINKPAEGQPLTDHVLVSILNGLFCAVAKVFPSANGVHCLECHKELTQAHLSKIQGK